MKNYKKLLQDILINNANIEKEIALEIVEESNEKFDSDYSIVCFKLAKIFSKSPQIIAEELKQYFINIPEIEYVAVVSGYINISINKKDLIEEVLYEFNNRKDKYGISKEVEEKNKNKTILVEYSSPNIAKEFHIGHLKTTLIGAYLYRLNKFLGYNTIGINHLGDYGTQFGKLIEGYNLWKDEYDFNNNPIEKLTEIYVRINKLCSENEEALDKCRENFKKLEEGDENTRKIWEYFVNLSLNEFNKTYEKLNISFDEIRGESKYSELMSEVIKKLDDNNLLIESQGAKIVDLEKYDLGIAVIQKSNDSSLYITRDLATIFYRINKYDFDECLYVVGSEQILHFRQLFKIAELLGIDYKYLKGLKHIPYGMVRLPSGKMSTREGNVIKVEELLEEAIDRAYEIIDKKDNIESNDERKDIARKVGIGAVVFNNISTTLIKDQVFDWKEVLNFSGETGPYIQYNYVRINNLFKEYNIPKLKDVNLDILFNNKESYKLIREIYKYGEILELSRNKDEPTILTQYILNLTKEFSNFYTDNRILVDDKNERDTKLYLSHMIACVIKNSCDIMGINLPDKM